MARFLVNLGSNVTVDAENETEAVQLAKESNDQTYFHAHAQEVIIPEEVNAAAVEEAQAEVQSANG